MNVNDVVELAKNQFPRAHGFHPVQEQDGKIMGWTFAISRFLITRYGWVSSDGIIIPDVCSTREQAKGIMEIVVRDRGTKNVPRDMVSDTDITLESRVRRL